MEFHFGLLCDKTGMETFRRCDEDGDVFVRLGVLGEGLVPCSIGYVVRFGWIIW